MLWERPKRFLIFVLVVFLMMVGSAVFAADPEPDDFQMDISESLTAWAWKNYKERTPEGYQRAIKWAEICTYNWGPRAIAQSEGLASYPPGSISEVYAKYWALNDVATCYFIMGEAWRMDNSPQDANNFYFQIVNNDILQEAKCWDLGPDNEFGTVDDFSWKVAEAAQDRMALAPNDVPIMPDIYPTPVK